MGDGRTNDLPRELGDNAVIKLGDSGVLDCGETATLTLQGINWGREPMVEDYILDSSSIQIFAYLQRCQTSSEFSIGMQYYTSATITTKTYRQVCLCGESDSS